MNYLLLGNQDLEVVRLEEVRLGGNVTPPAPKTHRFENPPG
jgi:hypothetical protein